jgi:hypothetical protein
MKGGSALVIVALVVAACSSSGGGTPGTGGSGGGGTTGTGGTGGGAPTAFFCLGSDGVPPDGGAAVCNVGETYCARQANKDGTFAAPGQCKPFTTSSTCPTINPTCGPCVTEYAQVNCTCTSSNGEVVVTCKQI